MSIIESIKVNGLRDLDRFKSRDLIQGAIDELEDAIMEVQSQLDMTTREDDPDWWRRAMGAMRFYKLALKRLNIAQTARASEGSDSRSMWKRSITEWQAFAKSLAEQLEENNLEPDTSRFPEFRLTFDEWMDEER